MCSIRLPIHLAFVLVTKVVFLIYLLCKNMFMMFKSLLGCVYLAVLCYCFNEVDAGIQLGGLL